MTIIRIDDIRARQNNQRHLELVKELDTLADELKRLELTRLNVERKKLRAEVALRELEDAIIRHILTSKQTHPVDQ